MNDFDLKAFRTKLGISQAELAKRMGRNQGGISYIESGKRKMTRRFFMHLAAIFKEHFEEEEK